MDPGSGEVLERNEQEEIEMRKYLKTVPQALRPVGTKRDAKAARLQEQQEPEVHLASSPGNGSSLESWHGAGLCGPWGVPRNLGLYRRVDEKVEGALRKASEPQRMVGIPSASLRQEAQGSWPEHSPEPPRLEGRQQTVRVRPKEMKIRAKPPDLTSLNLSFFVYKTR